MKKWLIAMGIFLEFSAFPLDFGVNFHSRIYFGSGMCVTGKIDTVFSAHGSVLLMLDPKGLYGMEIIDSYDLPNTVNDIIYYDTNRLLYVLSGMYMYILGSNSGSLEYKSHISIGRIFSVLKGAELDYPFLYVYSISGIYSTLYCVDVSNETSPGITDSITFSIHINDIEVRDSLLYLACGDSGLIVVNKNNPYNLVVVDTIRQMIVDTSGGTVYTPVNPTALELYYGVLYMESNQKLKSMDILTGWAYDSLNIQANHLFARENRLYTASGEYGIYICNIFDPENITLLGTYDSVTYANWVWVSYDTLIYCSDRDSGLKMLDAVNPGYTYSVGEFFTPKGEPVGLVSSTTTLYTTDGEGGISLISVSDPVNPFIYSVLYEFPGGVEVHSPDLWNDTLYVVGGPRVYSVDVTYPYTPVLFDSSIYLNDAEDIRVTDSLIFVANGMEGLEILDRDGGYEISSYNNWYWILSGVDASGNVAVGLDASTLVLYNVSNPTMVDTFSTLAINNGSDLSITGNYVVVASVTNGILIVDISNPYSPSVVGSYSGIQAQYIDTYGDYVFVSTGDSTGVYILSIADPSNVQLIGHYSDFPRDPEDICYIDNRNFAVSLGASGVYILEALNVNVEEKIADFSCEFSDPYKIRLSLDKKTMVDIEAFNVLGSRVGRLYQGYLSPGEHEIHLGLPDNLSSGIYFIQVKAGERRYLNRVMWIK